MRREHPITRVFDANIVHRALYVVLIMTHMMYNVVMLCERES